MRIADKLLSPRGVLVCSRRLMSSLFFATLRLPSSSSPSPASSSSSQVLGKLIIISPLHIFHTCMFMAASLIHFRGDLSFVALALISVGIGCCMFCSDSFLLQDCPHLISA